MLYISFKQVKNRESLFFSRISASLPHPIYWDRNTLCTAAQPRFRFLRKWKTNCPLARKCSFSSYVCEKRFSSSLPQLLFQLEHFRCQCGTHTISFSSLQRLECRSVKNNLSLFSYWNSWGGKNLGEEHFSFPCFGIITVSRYETSKKVVRGHRRSCALQNPLD